MVTQPASIAWEEPTSSAGSASGGSRANLLSRREISWSKLQEDHIFGLLVHAVGLRLGDFATGSLPMGIVWRGLPCSPEELVARKKRSYTRRASYGDLTEGAIREYFREQRRKDRA